MTSRIRVLDEHTINKIAAGEVIENPASVVKELVENAMDAGATSICVEIRGGGRQLIRITDNGIGMNSDDALLCLERHATSKIREVEDIHEIYTMGFRGEAVPSIASISKFTLMTCPRVENGQEAKATMITVDGGKIMQCCTIARDPGTTIEVKSLFFNVPVRKKFQKSPAYDSNEILKMLTNIAMGNPYLKFELISDQKTVLETRAAEKNADFANALKKSVREVLGDEFADSTHFIEASQNNCTIAGYIGDTNFTRHNRTGQYLFINKRAVVSPLVSFAVREGYGTALMTNRHPAFVLHLTIPGSLVDINVHPQKREVRLRQEQTIKELITKAVRDGLQQGTPHFFDSIELAPITLPSYVETIEPSFQKPLNPFARLEQQRDLCDPLPEDLPKIAVKQPAYTPQIKIPEPEKSLFIEPHAKIRVLAAIKQYILVDPAGDALCLVDQRSAHTRVIYEKLLQQMNDGKQLPVQQLLIPHTLETTPAEANLLVQNLEILNQFGISIRQSGNTAFIVDALPQIFGNTDVQLLIMDMVHTFAENSGKQSLQQQREKQLAVAANRAAISSHKQLSMMEAQTLIDQLMDCKFPYICPQGKAVMVRYSQEEISRRFKNG